jgi:3-hydroxyisobutyrate dehydrogenase
MTETVTFIGLGTMGRPMARNLAGTVPVMAYDADPRVVAAVAGHNAITGLADVLEGAGADVVILMLPNSSIVGQVLGDPADQASFCGHLRRGALVVDMGSSAPWSTRELAGRLRGRGVAVVDAPVSGGPRNADAAGLTIMAGGAAEDVGRVMPLLEVMGGSVTHVGPVGSAHALKALNNMLSAIGLVGALEVLTVGAKFGLDPRVMLDVINSSTGRNQATEVKIGPEVLDGRFDVGFSLPLTVKDVTTAAELSRSMGLAPEVSAACVRVCQAALETLDAPNPDQSEIAKYLAGTTGVDLTRQIVGCGDREGSGEHALLRVGAAAPVLPVGAVLAGPCAPLGHGVARSEIVPGREQRPGSAQDHDTHAVVCLGRQHRVAKLDEKAAILRVPGLGAIQRDPRDGPIVEQFISQVLISEHHHLLVSGLRVPSTLRVRFPSTLYIGYNNLEISGMSITGKLATRAGQASGVPVAFEQSGSQLRLPKAAELLAARIRGQIVRGELKAGDRLPAESELMERFGVSRPTLREAIRVLEMESLLRMRRGSRGGALITSPDPQVAARAVGVLLQLRGVSLRDIHEARMMIEPTAARRIAESHDASPVLDTLRERNEEARANVRDFREFPHRSWSFHKTLVEGARNETLTVLWQMIADIIELQVARRYSRLMQPNEVEEQIRQNLRSVRANDKLLKLLESRDADAAEAYWIKHLRAVGESLLGPDPDAVVDLPD